VLTRPAPQITGASCKCKLAVQSHWKIVGFSLAGWNPQRASLYECQPDVSRQIMAGCRSSDNGRCCGVFACQAMADSTRYRSYRAIPSGIARPDGWTTPGITHRGSSPVHPGHLTSHRRDEASSEASDIHRARGGILWTTSRGPATIHRWGDRPMGSRPIVLPHPRPGRTRRAGESERFLDDDSIHDSQITIHWKSSMTADGGETPRSEPRDQVPVE